MAKSKSVSKFAAAAAKADPADSRGDEFEPGKFLVTLTGCHEADNGAFCFKFEGAGQDRKIGARSQWFSTTGKAVYLSQKAIKRLCMILVGESDADAYNEFDPGGEFLDSIVKGEFAAAGEYMAENGKGKSAAKAQAALEATEFYVSARKGSEKDDGTFFINADFSAANDSDEDEDEDEDDAPESEEAPAPRASKKASKRATVRDEEDDEEDDEDEAPDSEPAPKAKKKAARK